MKTILAVFVVLVSLLAAAWTAPALRRGETREAAVADPKGIAGSWEGQWESQKNGHKGALRCEVELGSDGKYTFRYRAAWGKIMKGNFQITCQVKPSGGGTWAVSGTKNLGLFGTYHHEGTITPRSFQATFRSDRKNLGAFRMKRPEGWKL